MTGRGPIVVSGATPHDAPDAQLESLLHRVYVEGGFTPAHAARSIFDPPSVRARGDLLVARAPESDAVIGMVVVVPPTSAARRLADSDEAEMHLLAVLPEQRGSGVGRALVDAAMAHARNRGWAKMVLWTQPTMTSAQRLYQSAGFRRAPAREPRIAEITGRPFLVFVKPLQPALPT